MKRRNCGLKLIFLMLLTVMILGLAACNKTEPIVDTPIEDDGSKEEDKDNFVRNVYDITFENNGDYVNIIFRGNGFMRYMIRYMVGTALEVARGRMTLEEVKALLDENSERNIVSFKAPAEGLLLLEVRY